MNETAKSSYHLDTDNMCLQIRFRDTTDAEYIGGDPASSLLMRGEFDIGRIHDGNGVLPVLNCFFRSDSQRERRSTCFKLFFLVGFATGTAFYLF